MNTPLDDRNYYRQLDDYELVELSKSKPTAELAVVLGQRLVKLKRVLTYGGDHD